MKYYIIACMLSLAKPTDNFILVKKLLESVANPHTKTKKGNYPLAFAVNNDLDEVAKLLYETTYQ